MLDFMNKHRLPVLAIVDATGNPEATIFGFAHNDALELIFNTSTTTLKYRNPRANPRAALVIGWEEGHWGDTV